MELFEDYERRLVGIPERISSSYLLTVIYIYIYYIRFCRRLLEMFSILFRECNDTFRPIVSVFQMKKVGIEKGFLFL